MRARPAALLWAAAAGAGRAGSALPAPASPHWLHAPRRERQGAMCGEGECNSCVAEQRRASTWASLQGILTSNRCAL